MVVMILQRLPMEQFVERLRTDFPDVNFELGTGFFWSPQTKSISYKLKSKQKNIEWTLLHEVAHAQLKHINYRSDVELLNMEVAAWAHACELAGIYKLKISDDHIQNCLDSYRNWLHQRSTCPICYTHSLQQDSDHYRCYNCHTVWKVSAARFCRPYRKIQSQIKTSLKAKPQAMFL